MISADLLSAFPTISKRNRDDLVWVYAFPNDLLMLFGGSSPHPTTLGAQNPPKKTKKHKKNRRLAAGLGTREVFSLLISKNVIFFENAAFS